MTTPYKLLTLAILLSASISISHATDPNIVIIICDDLNDSIEGIGGHPQAYTPNINRIADNGVTFTNAASNAPICGPSRASLWSGIHPITSGMYGKDQQSNRWNNNVVLSSKKTLFEHFIDEGYYSYATGKIHHNGHESPYSTIMRNYDNTVGFENQGNYGSYNNKPGNFGPYPNSSNAVFQGVDPQWWPQAYKNRAGPPYSGFGAYRDLSTYGGKWTYQSGGSNNANFTTWNMGDLVPDEICAAQAVRFINTYNESRPFLLTVGFVRPHSPYYAPAEFFESPYVPALNDIQLAPINANDYNDITGPVTQSTQDLAQTSGWYKYTSYKNMGNDVGDPDIALKEFTQAYLACVAFVDAQVGKILDAIEASSDSNVRDNTIVIFTSDHGYHLGEKQYIFKQSPWEESCRVPFVVSGPGVVSGQVCNKPISLVDVYATCVDIAGISTPHTLDGHSIKPLLADPINGSWAGSVYSVSGIGSSASVSTNQVAPYSQQHFSIRTDQYRYIYYRNGEEELYDHSNDPNEWTNVVSSGSYSTALDQMRSYYRYAVGLEEEPPPLPIFSLTQPVDGSSFYSAQSIELVAQSNETLSLSHVDFYVNGTLYKTDSVAPYSAVFYDAPSGNNTILAQGSDASGSTYNANVNVSVGAIAENNILNANFDNLSNGALSGESDIAPIGFFGTADRSVTNVYSTSGNKSLLIGNRIQNYSSIKYDLSSLTIGETYQISCNIRLANNSGTPKFTLRNAGYETLAELNYTGGWAQLTAEFTPQSGDLFIYIAGVNAGIDIYVDDFRVYQEGGNINPNDTDMDGMPDSWEVTNFGGLGASATGDNDNDGVSNLVEYRTGTDPSIGYLNYFHIYYKSFAGGITSIGWIGSTEKLYRVLGTTDLSTGNWEVLGEALPNTNGLEYYNESNSGAPNKFYKIEIDE